MTERILDWLIGARSDDVVFSHVGFDVPLPFALCVLLLLAAIVATLALYWRGLADLRQPYRTALVGLRTGFIGLAVLLALDPVLVGQRVRPGEQFVALVFDDSQSMRIAGEDGRTRAERLTEAYALAQESFEERVESRHRIARYRAGATAIPIEGIDRLQFGETQSELVAAIDAAQTDLARTTLAAVVLFSDGILQGSEESERDPATLAPDIPVFTVGVEEPSPWKDVGLTELSYQRSHFEQSPLHVNVGFNASGLAGREVVVDIRDGARVVASETIAIQGDEREHSVRLEFLPLRDGWAEFEARVRVKGAGGLDADAPTLDRIEENNARRFVIDNQERRYRSLYYAGRPTWENKFLRRALKDDPQLQLANLIAISGAERKFVFRGKKSTISNPLFEGFDEDRDRPRYDESVYLRLGVEEGELSGGFPASAEELFAYDLIILGDAERGFLNDTQMELLRDFVEIRGGALLVMGGSRAFTEGGYTESLLEDMLPVALYTGRRDSEQLRIEAPFHVLPTMEGKLTGVWSMNGGEGGPQLLEEDRPQWFGLNRFAVVRPGATVMAEALFDDPTLGQMPLYAVQRYGEGLCAVLATSDTWQWQMQREEKDLEHERLWRQIVRSLVEEADAATYWRNKSDAYGLGSLVRMEFQVRDASFEPGEGLQTSVIVTTPTKAELALPVDESIEEPGVYTAEFAAEEPGVHLARLVSTDDAGESVAALSEGFLVQPDHGEFQNARYDEAFLRRLAKETGGAFFSLEQLDELAAAIPVPVRPDAEQVVVHFWHRPLFFALLAAMMIPEWYLRRIRGRA